MKFALVQGEKTVATKGAIGFCPGCGARLVPHCGKKYIHHWKHKGKRNCDKWWENETEWHRAWKEQFPVNWQEIVHKDQNGEKHIADVKTEHGWVFEFQHSYLKDDERKARDAFYQNLIWVVDGMRRKRDIPQFERALDEGIIINNSPTIWNVFIDECRLLEEWVECRSPVLFDFYGVNKPEGATLWLLLPWRLDGRACVLKVPWMDFIKFQRVGRNTKGKGFAEILENYKKILIYYQHRRAQEMEQIARQIQSRQFRLPLPRRSSQPYRRKPKRRSYRRPKSSRWKKRW